RRHSHPQSRGHVSRNLIYPPLLSQSQTVVVGGLWNCQSAVRKADFISALASHYSFDFLALTETWIPPQNTATPAALSSAYTFSHSPRESGRGGGTVSVTSPINLFIIVIYRPPGPLGNFLDEMDTLLSVFPSDSTPLTVLGDFNLPSDKLHSSGLLALLNSFSLSFKSCPPTHKEGIVLDLVFTHPSPVTDMTVTPLHTSDHHLVSFSITLPVLPKRNSQHLSLTRRNLHSISPCSVASCTLSSLPDHESFSSLPLDSATDTLLSSLSSTMDLLCPLSTICRKNSSPAPWLSDVLRNNRRELRSAARKWKKSKLDTDLISYRTLLSKFSLDVTSAKTSFYKEKLETSAQDPRKLHNIFLSLLNPPAPPSPSSLTAEDFASFYTEKIERICQTFTSLPTSPTSHNQHSATPSLTQLSTVAAEEVLQITRSCNPTTCPLDPIPSAMLQTISPDLLPFITTVINGSLTSGHVPTAFKKARVIPILKKPALDPSDISNYRPVSLLSFLSKILERVVCNQLSDYLMQNNLLDPNQSGFKAAHSTETALLAVTEKLHAARSAKLSSVLILLDLSAAFDTVNHKTLLSTLRSLGICGTAWEWFASYLDGCSYQVTWKGLTSAPRRLSTGVPQGSVLGPLLFSLYTHSLGKVISSHGFSYHCYADDTQLIFSFPPSDTTTSARISACLADISSWMTAHQLKLNPSKTELLIIPGDPSPAQDLAISLSNSMISPTASARNLGVTMDNRLSFSSHVTNVTRSCRFLLYNIRRIRPFLTTQATQTELACRESLSQYVATAIRLDNLLHQHRAGARPPISARPCPDYPRPCEEALEPMQLGRSRLTEWEHQRRTQMRLCYYCGGSGHLIHRCPEKPSSVQMGDSSLFFSLMVPVSLCFTDRISSECVIAYIDGILVYSTSLEEHAHHVRAVLSRLQQNHLYIKPEKCEFNQTTITFLGYVILRQGVKMDLTKVRTVTEWPNPTTIKELQQFLGFANFYGRFIQNYSSMAGR
ncbi:hypothetical protein QTP86_002173, partial [Hemibagrus guttatus]